jgi:hypothetical protein
MNIPIDWLLAGDPWVEYRTRLDLLGEPIDSEKVQNARTQMVNHPLVRGLVAELQGWPGVVLNSHKSASQFFHKLTFMADLGLRVEDEGVDAIVSKIMEHPSSEGPFTLPTNVTTHFGGTGETQYAWALCDAPLTVYGLVKLGLEEDPMVQYAIQALINLVRDNGWPCAVSKELGKFRGPGRKEDPCPFANLAMLKLLSSDTRLRDHSSARKGTETLLRLWQDSQTDHPYIFYMGDDFRKLKAPLVWYDLLHVLDVLSAFPWLKSDARLLDMAAVLQKKMDSEGKFTAESIWTAWKEWEFGQKKVPSRWVTFLAWRNLHRLGFG